MTFDQSAFDVRFEWGTAGFLELAPVCDVLVIVDVLSFSTAVEIACQRGAIVYPPGKLDEDPRLFASSINALLAHHRGARTGYSLSPVSLLEIPSGTRLVLPSLNGAQLSMAALSMKQQITVLAGCLRNAHAVAQAAQHIGEQVAVIAAGECWRGEASLRPAWEDLIGAGAILRHLPGKKSPEAQSAVAAFDAAVQDLERNMLACSSGRELVELGFAGDVLLSAQVDVSNCVPRLVDGAYVHVAA